MSNPAQSRLILYTLTVRFLVRRVSFNNRKCTIEIDGVINKKTINKLIVFTKFHSKKIRVLIKNGYVDIIVIYLHIMS